jgi:cysteine desulfurase
MDRRYFDWAATSPPDPEIPPMDDIPFGNPSSMHAEGRAAREALETARARCAAALGAEPENIVFTSGGSESNALVLHSLLLRQGKPGLAISAVEHPSVRENAGMLKRLGYPLVQVEAGGDGMIHPEAVEKAVGRNTGIRMVALMAVNNETGADMDLKALSQAIRSRAGPPAHLHCDGVQAFGKLPIDLQSWDVDSLSLSAHKFGGPRGIGLLYVRNRIETLAMGGGQERGLRPGTENLRGALAMAYCMEQRGNPRACAEAREAAESRMAWLLPRLRSLGRCVVVPENRSDRDPRFSPYILQLAFPPIPAEVMVRALDDRGIAAATGSACSSASKERPVLAAMGVGPETASCAFRLSQGWTTTDEDMEVLLGTVKRILESV